MYKFIKIINIVTISVFVLSILPILYMGRYIQPLWDDYGSSYVIHLLVIAKQYYMASFEILLNAIWTWFAWQGTYSAEMLFAMQPGAWIIPSYWVTPFIIIGSITAAYILFWRTLAKYVFQSKASYGTIIAMLILTVQFQYTPYIHSAFYWFNGAIYYGFFYALMIIEISYVIRMLFSNEYNKRLLIFLAVFISGGNYSTALINVLILICMCMIAYIQKSEKLASLKLITIAALFGFAISILAPGNAVRAAENTAMPAGKAIISSIIYALKNIYHWFRLPQIGLILLLTPIVYYMVRNVKISFGNMMVAVIILFGLFAAQATPAFYAMSHGGAERQIDMYYYSFYMLMILCLVCFVTWIASVSKKKWLDSKNFRVMAVGVSLFGMIIFIYGVHNIGISETNTYKVMAEIGSGRAAAYEREFNEKIDEIIASDKECYIKDIENSSDILPSFGLNEDPEYWTNNFLALYYGKEKIHLITEY